MAIIKPNKSDYVYERVIIDDWISGKIVEVQERNNPNRKYKDKNTGEWKTKAVDEVRFVFELDGYKYKHYSRWMTQSVHKKSTLYDKYLKKLDPSLEPETAVDLDRLAGIEVRTMWDEETGRDGAVYQHVASIKPLAPVALGVEIENKGDVPF